MLIALVIAFGMNLFAYWNADKMVLKMYGARQVDARTAPEFYRIVEGLAARAGLPMPKVFVIDSPQPNAFATGRNPENAAVAASIGLLESLSPEEVAGVMAHELAHVEHRDTLTMTITATLAGAISMLANFALLLRRQRDNNNPLGFVGVLAAMIVAPLAAMMVQMAVSRTREYEADRRGAEICGQPLWLASALGKIAGASRIDPESGRGTQSSHGTHVHHQSAQRPTHGWSVLDPSGDRKSYRGPARTGVRQGRSGRAARLRTRRPTWLSRARRRRDGQSRGRRPVVARPAWPQRTAFRQGRSVGRSRL